MKIKFSFESEKLIVLPVGFKEILQWFIYSSIKDEWLHDTGFTQGKRSFKLFCFSEILEKGKYLKDKKRFIFPHIISFVVSSPVDWILEKLATGSLLNTNINLGGNNVVLHEISIVNSLIDYENNVTVKALSPIEVHSTFEIRKRKKTYYYSAFDPEFARLVNENMQKKWEAFYKKKCPFELSIKPLKNNKEKIVRFGASSRYVIVKGWNGFFGLKGEQKLLKFALDAGLGSRNPQGFGMVEVVREEQRWKKK